MCVCVCVIRQEAVVRLVSLFPDQCWDTLWAWLRSVDLPHPDSASHFPARKKKKKKLHQKCHFNKTTELKTQAGEAEFSVGASVKQSGCVFTTLEQRGQTSPRL